MTFEENTIKKLGEAIQMSKRAKDKDYEASWGYETGVLLTRKEANLCFEALKNRLTPERVRETIEKATSKWVDNTEAVYCLNKIRDDLLRELGLDEAKP